MKAIVTNIQYDTDGEVVTLPTQLEIDIPSDIEEDDVDDFVSDEISNITGYCHFGFEMKMIVDDEPQFMCNCCHDHFPREEMDFDVDDDQDLCKNCNYQSYNDAPYGEK